MLTFTLEPTDDRAKPVFKDVRSCKTWLETLQLTNMKLAHSLLLTEISELNRFAMRGTERMETLEVLRDTVSYVQHEYAKKLVAKPLPLTEHELTQFIAIVQLWQALATGYQRCLQTLFAGDLKLEKHKALLCLRAMQYVERAIAEHWHLGYEVDGKLWQQMHSLYSFAVQQPFLSEKISDPLDPERPQDTCHEAFLRTLLTDYARPAEFSRAQLKLLASWLPQFIAMLSVDRQYSASRGDAPPLAFDLNNSTHGLRLARSVRPDASVRYLAMVPVSKSIRVRTILLQQGKAPKQVELGDIANGQDCIDLLTLLHRNWCEDPDLHFAPTATPNEHILVCSHIENIHAHLTGKTVAQSAPPDVSDSEARKQIETFGRVLQNVSSAKQASHMVPAETWLIARDNGREAVLVRLPASGGQLSRGQLVGVRRAREERYSLAATKWVNVMRTGRLHIGVHFLPGEVEPVMLHAVGTDRNVLTKPAFAFLLHALPESKIPPSLIMPRIWFSSSRIVEMHSRNGEKQNLKLGFSVEHGLDFERVSFMPA